MNLAGARQEAGRGDGKQQRHSGVGQPNSDDATGEGDEETLREQLAH